MKENALSAYKAQPYFQITYHKITSFFPPQG